MSDSLTLKQEKFVAAYIGVANGNATEAARIAGYAWPLKQADQLLGKTRIARAIAEHKAAIRDEGIANRQNRINAQNARWEALHTIVEERAAEYAGEAPGAGTGYMVRTYRQIGQGETARLVEEWAPDAALLAEFRQLEQHSAKETGQWDDKATLTVVPKALIGIDLDRV